MLIAAGDDRKASTTAASRSRPLEYFASFSLLSECKEVYATAERYRCPLGAGRRCGDMAISETMPGTTAYSHSNDDRPCLGQETGLAWRNDCHCLSSRWRGRLRDMQKGSAFLLFVFRFLSLWGVLDLCCGSPVPELDLQMASAGCWKAFCHCCWTTRPRRMMEG